MIHILYYIIQYTSLYTHYYNDYNKVNIRCVYKLVDNTYQRFF